MSQPLRLASLSVQDTFGVTSVKFRPGTITRIRGRNGSGKSSIARGFLRVFEGGHDPSIIRRGAEKSIVDFTLTDGTVVHRVCEPMKRRKGAPEDEPVRFKTTLEILDADGTPREAPATYLKELGEPVAIDPGKLLRLDVTTKPGLEAFAAEVQKVMALSWTPDEVLGALEPPKLNLRDSDGRELPDCRTRVSLNVPIPQVTETLDLKGMKKFIAGVTESRRRVGHTRDDSDGAINSLEKSLPPDDGVDYSAALVAAEQERDAFQKLLINRKLEVERLKNETMTTARAGLVTAHSEIDSEIDQEIRELERHRAQRKAAATSVFDKQRDAIDQTVGDELKAIEAEVSLPLQNAISRIADLRGKIEGSLRAKFTREQIAKQTENLRAASRQYDLLTDFIARLEQSMRSKLAELPIPGLLVDDDGVSLDGIPWQNVNTARRVEVVLQLCALRSGRLGFFFLDDAEHLDSDTMAALELGIAQAGYQLVEAMVSEDETLTIETLEPMAA